MTELATPKPRTIAIVALSVLVAEMLFPQFVRWFGWTHTHRTDASKGQGIFNILDEPEVTYLDPADSSPLHQLLDVLLFGHWNGQFNWIRPLLFVAIGLYALFRYMPIGMLREVGLWRSPLNGLTLAVVITLPALAVVVVAQQLFGLEPEPDLGQNFETLILPGDDAEDGPFAFGFLSSALLRPFATIVILYGFAFKLLRTRVGWSFWKAVSALLIAEYLPVVADMVPGIGFGLNPDPLFMPIGIALTFVTTACVAWLFTRWNYDLWVVFLYGLGTRVMWELLPEHLDSHWELVSASNLAALATLVAITIWWGKRRERLAADAAVS